MKKWIVFLSLALIILPVSAAIVYTQDFETGTIPQDWSQQYEVGTVDWQINNGGQNDHPPAANSGNFNAWFFDASTDGNSTRLITPEFEITTHARLTFWYCMDSWTSFQDYLNVYYRNDPAAEWELLQAFTQEAAEWTRVIIDLPNPSSTYSLAFEGEAYWGYGVCLDDLMIEDCVFNILVWDNDNSSDYTDPNNGQYYNCENSITLSLDELNLEYDQVNSLPGDLEYYDIIMIELGLYCVG